MGGGIRVVAAAFKTSKDHPHRLLLSDRPGLSSCLLQGVDVVPDL